tara:strand:+ start:229 stop:519 length:291 start_codon:yes stop_codon:yes gene_type:complete
MGKHWYAAWLYEIVEVFRNPWTGLTDPRQEWNQEKILRRVHDACDLALVMSRDNQLQLGHAIDRIRENLDWMENFQDDVSKRSIHSQVRSVTKVPA